MNDTTPDSTQDPLERIDETGIIPEDLCLSLTPEAVAAAYRIKKEVPEYVDLPMRIYIEGKGCDGFYYGVSFDERKSDDLSQEQDGLIIIIDRQSFRFMHGSVVNWVDDERGQGFLVENPNQRKFRGKFFKRKIWQERLTGESSTSE